jgi:hypothetical protein
MGNAMTPFVVVEEVVSGRMQVVMQMSAVEAVEYQYRIYRGTQPPQTVIHSDRGAISVQCGSFRALVTRPNERQKPIPKV